MADPNYGLGQAGADEARAWAKERTRKARERDKKRRQRGQNEGGGGTSSIPGGFVEGSGTERAQLSHIWEYPAGWATDHFVSRYVGVGVPSEVAREVAMLKAEGRGLPGMVGMRYPMAGREGRFTGPGRVDLRKAQVLGGKG